MAAAAASSTRDLYTLLKVDKTSTQDEIHRAYKKLSTTFHPDKLPPTTSEEKRDRVQAVFLEFKRASTFFPIVVLSISLWTFVQIDLLIIG